MRVTASIWNPSGTPVDAFLCASPESFGWRLLADSNEERDLPRRSSLGACVSYDAARASLRPLTGGGDSLPGGKLVTARLQATVPESEDYSSPYFLRLPRVGDLYQWDPNARASWGLPFEAQRLTLTIRTSAEGRAASAPREVTFRGNDQGSGEFRRPVTVVPPGRCADRP